MTDRVAAIEANIASLQKAQTLAEQEAEFVKKKEAGTLTREDKDSLRVAREDYRDNHRQPAIGAAPGVMGVDDQGEVV